MGTATLPKSDWLELDPVIWVNYRNWTERALDQLDAWVYPPVKTKRDMVRRYSNPEGSEFGNASPTWDSFKEWEASNPMGELYHIRNRVAGAQTWYNIRREQVRGYWHMLVDVWKLEASQLYISEMAPKHLLNGELMRTHEGLYLFYSTVQKPMRDSLKEGGREAKGLTAKFILQHYMNQRSYDWTMMLLDRYKDHVIEFTVVDRCWGTVPGYNTLFWEIRKDY